METLSPALQTAPGPPPVQSVPPPFRYDGEGLALFRIYLKNILLTIATLGIYSF